MTTKARIRYKRQERLQRQATDRIVVTLSADQRSVLSLSHTGYAPGEIARELALAPEYVTHFMRGLIQRLTQERLIPSPDWRNVLLWAEETDLISPVQ